MYTQVSFGEFLDNVIAQSDLEFSEYPNVAIRWQDGDWGYEILNDMSVRIFRYGIHGDEVKLDGPKWHDVEERREAFEPRFENAFKNAVADLKLIG